MSNQTITQALTSLFERQRFVFWYDTRKEFRSDFETLDLPAVEKVEIINNEFGLKYRILVVEPEQKFLLYREGPEPPPLQNWLLDVQLACGHAFRTDQAALWLAELELGPNFHPLMESHIAFFEATKRRDSLRKMLESSDTETQLKRKMLAVCVGSEARLDVMLESLLGDLASEEQTRIKLIDRCGLSGFLWDQMKRAYGYNSNQPSLRDFVTELFKDCFLMGTDPGYQPTLATDSLVFLRRWKDSRFHEQGFEMLSEKSAEVLQIEDRLQTLDYQELMEIDYFELVDRKILTELVHSVEARTVSAQEVQQWVRQRRQSHWFDRFKDEYEAVEHAVQFTQLLDMTPLEMDSLADGVQKYAKSWYRLDQHYRKFVFHLRRSGQASLLGDLNTLVDNLYSNSYLSKLNDRWQAEVDAAQNWEADPIVLQKDFFEEFVRPYLNRKNKVCILISDAFRYEIGEELQNLIRQEDRFDADLKPVLSMLPSYTQLGMAALLPNRGLEIAGTGDAMVNGKTAQGSINRSKILAAEISESAVVLAKDLMAMGRDESRALLRDNDVLYIYHNLIDKTGDTRDTEERVFAAAEETLGELIRLVKKLTNANASNVLITADHGFIYQNHTLQESDFLSVEPEGDEVLYKDRRFVLGKRLRESASFKSFKPAQLGLGGTLDVQIPKSINRLRLKGSGSRFIHGGATLQEVVIPVISINKKRQSDVSRVEVEFIGGGGKTITTGQLAIVLYQCDAVKEKLQPRRLRAGLFTLDDELVSDQHELRFDFGSSNPRERELPVRFILSRKADEANNQQVELRLEELVEDTTHFTVYKAVRYMIRRSLTSDFDF
jgi:uncharacterized protein (TIGR02687 family)